MAAEALGSMEALQALVSASTDAGFVAFRWTGRNRSPGADALGASERSPSDRML